MTNIKKSTFSIRFLRETRLGLVTSCLLIAGVMTQSLSAATNTAVKAGDINTLTTWSATSAIPLPVAGDANIWSTGAYALSSTLPATFNGGTLDIATNGSLTMNTAGPVTLTLNNLTLDGGSIIAGAAMYAVTLDLQNKTFTLNSGIFTTNANQGGRSILVQNANLAGSGNITIAQYNSGGGENWVELTNTGVTTSGFTGTFTVVPGVSAAGKSGELKISAPTSGTFGVSVPAPTGTGSYAGSVAGKLFFNPGAGNTCTLASLNLGGINIAPGIYTLAQLNGYGGNTLSAYLNQSSTGTITIFAIVNAPASVVATNVNGVASVAFTGGGTSFTVTPYDVTTSTAGTPVTGLTSPILVSGLTNGDNYTFTVTATNQGVTSQPSAASNQITIFAPGTVTAVTTGEINTLTTWSATSAIPIPVAGDANTWSTGVGTGTFAITESATPVTFYGGTFYVTTGGALNMNPGSSVLNFNNVSLNGGIISTSSGVNVTLNLQNNRFILNSGTIKYLTNQGANRTIQVQNANLWGSGTITIGTYNPKAGTQYENWVELQSTVTTSGFSGKFEVVPGVYDGTVTPVGNSLGGELKISCPTSGTFGVNVPAVNTTTGVISNGITYQGTYNGKLFFNPGAGNTCTLASLNLGGTDITPGVYAYSNFTTAQQAYLNSNSTGTLTITGAVKPPTNVIGGTLVSFTDTLNNGGYAITSYTVTPYDVTTSTAGTPVSGTSSPIAVSGLILNHSYTFTLTATNTFNVTSAASVPSAPIVITAPGAPIIGKAYTSGLNGTAYVAFTAPQSTGGSAITSYKATSNPAGGTGTFTDKVGSGIITVTGLTNKTSYTFTVKAINAYGTSVASAASNAVTVDPTTFVAPPPIIATSDPTITTNQITSGNFTIGISNLGGGYINQVIIPGIGDIMGVEAKRFGRGGQSAPRSRVHNGVYNPTQAGFNANVGTPCQIVQTTGKLEVEPHGAALWYGDMKYDFTRWENIGADPYNEKTMFGGALNASDQDGLDEENLAVDINGFIYTKQEAEVYSEFDYYGTYEDYLGKNGITIPAIRHYTEFRFIRPPGHALNQFRAGTLAWAPIYLRANIAHVNPAGVFPGTDKDMNTFVPGWGLRHDRSLWAPQYCYFRNTDKSWVVAPADSDAIPPTNDGTVFILADSTNPDAGHALGLYRPNTDINQYSVIGVNETTGNIVYKDDRMVLPTDYYGINKNMFEISTMSGYGFGGIISGMINRTRLAPNVYETLRAEYFIFCGTPNQIMAAVAAYDASISGINTDLSNVSRETKDDFQILSDASSGSFVVKLNTFKLATIRIYNPLGRLLYTTTQKTDKFSIHENEIGYKGVLLVEVNGITKKTILL